MNQRYELLNFLPCIAKSDQKKRESTSEFKWPAAPGLTSHMIMWPEGAQNEYVLLKRTHYQADIQITTE